MWNSGRLHIDISFYVSLWKGKYEIDRVDVPIVNNGKGEDEAYCLPRYDGVICVPVVKKID